MTNQKYYLTVTENTQEEVLYQRELKDDDLLDVSSYLDEVSRYLELPLDREPIESGLGQFNFRIGFSTDPSDVHCWESKDFFISDDY